MDNKHPNTPFIYVLKKGRVASDSHV